MAAVYILFSEELNRYYVGSCIDISERFSEHLDGKYMDSYTAKAGDWILYYALSGLQYKQARLIENHIKKMKSRQYIENLKKYSEISKKLIELYK